MPRTPILLSWSGGKDAAWALHALRQRDDVEVAGLFTTITEEYERISMQGIRVEVLHAQARAAGLAVIEARMPRQADNARYEATFADALQRAQARWPGVRDIAFGDLFLADIKAYRDAQCARLGSFPDAKLAEHAVEHVVRTHGAGHFAHGIQRGAHFRGQQLVAAGVQQLDGGGQSPIRLAKASGRAGGGGR